MAKGNFFVRLCYAVVGKTKDASKMTTKEVIEEFLRQKGVSSPREYFRKKFRKKVSIGLNFFSEKALETQSISELRRGIKKLNKRIVEHEEKIKNYKKLYPQWDTFSKTHQQGIIEHWIKEINTFKNEIANRNAEINKRGNNET